MIELLFMMKIFSVYKQWSNVNAHEDLSLFKEFYMEAYEVFKNMFDCF